jgi:mono/diheme cytochrome c family protein
VEDSRARAPVGRRGASVTCAPVQRLRIASCLPLAALVAAAATGCGDTIDVAQSDPPAVKRGAQLFLERCSGCHTFDAAGAQGSKPDRDATGTGERTNGPNFNERQETGDSVLYAIRNGGFSGAIMPANIVVGRDAEAVAAFVEKYAGQTTERSPDQSPLPER